MARDGVSDMTTTSGAGLQPDSGHAAASGSQLAPATPDDPKPAARRYSTRSTTGTLPAKRIFFEPEGSDEQDQDGQYEQAVAKPGPKRQCTSAPAAKVQKPAPRTSYAIRQQQRKQQHKQQREQADVREAEHLQQQPVQLQQLDQQLDGYKEVVTQERSTCIGILQPEELTMREVEQPAVAAQRQVAQQEQQQQQQQEVTELAPLPANNPQQDPQGERPPVAAQQQAAQQEPQHVRAADKPQEEPQGELSALSAREALLYMLAAVPPLADALTRVDRLNPSHKVVRGVASLAVALCAPWEEVAALWAAVVDKPSDTPQDKVRRAVTFAVACSLSSCDGRLCKSNALKEFCLAESDLRRVPWTLAEHPDGWEMHMYRVSDLVEVARKKYGTEAAMEAKRGRNGSRAAKAAATRAANKAAAPGRRRDMVDRLTALGVEHHWQQVVKATWEPWVKSGKGKKGWNSLEEVAGKVVQAVAAAKAKQQAAEEARLAAENRKKALFARLEELHVMRHAFYVHQLWKQWVQDGEPIAGGASTLEEVAQAVAKAAAEAWAGNAAVAMSRGGPSKPGPCKCGKDVSKRCATSMCGSCCPGCGFHKRKGG